MPVYPEARSVRRVPEQSLQEGLRRELMRGRRDVPQIGAVVAGSTPLMPYVVVDGAGAGIDVVNRYLRDRMLGDVSPLTCRSYGYDLLRWFRPVNCTKSW